MIPFVENICVSILNIQYIRICIGEKKKPEEIYIVIRLQLEWRNKMVTCHMLHIPILLQLCVTITPYF